MKYLVTWNDNGIHSSIFSIAGIHRLMSAAYNQKKNLQVCVWKLADDVYGAPTPMRIWYDWKFDKLSLFALNGDLVQISEHKKEAA